MKLSFSNFLIIDHLCDLWRHISKKRRRQFLSLLFLMVISGFSEMLSIGMVVPFLSVLLTPEILKSSNFIMGVFSFFDIVELRSQIIFLFIAFIVAALLSGYTRILLLFQSGETIFATGSDLSVCIYENALYRPYSFHLEMSSSKIIDGIANKANIVIFDILVPVINIISSTIILIAIITVLLYLNPIPSIASFLAIGFIYFCVITISKKRLRIISEAQSIESVKVIKLLQEGLGGIRDIIIDQTQNIYVTLFEKSDSALRKMQSQKQFIAYSPRYLVETIFLVCLSIAIIFIGDSENGVAGAIPMIGALVLGAQRMLPVLQQGYTGWAHIRASQSALNEVVELLKPNNLWGNDFPIASIGFKDSINIQAASLIFSNGVRGLSDVTFRVNKGDWIGIVGETGSGKSTLLDLFMGLLETTQGSIFVDGNLLKGAAIHSWQKLIAHVPQNIFLKDGSILENIAFGRDPKEINFDEVIEAAKLAQIHGDVISWPNGYKTIVGERGIRISGGQRQRIGLARAFYKKAEVLILDEATSALDAATEMRVMDALKSQGNRFTCLIVAHRLSTLSCCNKIIELTKGKISRSGDYASIIG